MRILVSNDDGIHSSGLKALVESLALEHEVYVVAPDRERSAAGHALTLHKPLRVEEVNLGSRIKRAWETTGTPGDCIKIGINSILDVMPDLIISGINHGPNLGTDVLYSGTVNAAMEGAVLGFPSIAVSLSCNGIINLLILFMLLILFFASYQELEKLISLKKLFLTSIFLLFLLLILWG